MSSLQIPGQLNFLIEHHEAAFAEPAVVNLQLPNGAKIIRWGGFSKRLRLAADMAAALLAAGQARPDMRDCFLIAQDLIDHEAGLVKAEQEAAIAKERAERQAATAGGPIVLP